MSTLALLWSTGIYVIQAINSTEIVVVIGKLLHVQGSHFESQEVQLSQKNRATLRAKPFDTMIPTTQAWKQTLPPSDSDTVLYTSECLIVNI